MIISPTHTILCIFLIVNKYKETIKTNYVFVHNTSAKFNFFTVCVTLPQTHSFFIYSLKQKKIEHLLGTVSEICMLLNIYICKTVYVRLIGVFNTFLNNNGGLWHRETSYSISDFSYIENIVLFVKKKANIENNRT